LILHSLHSLLVLNVNVFFNFNNLFSIRSDLDPVEIESST
jgi:hypothetical protein